MSDLTLVKKALPMFPQMLHEDLIAIKMACQRKLATVKGPRSIKTLQDAIDECNRLTTANSN